MAGMQNTVSRGAAARVFAAVATVVFAVLVAFFAAPGMAFAGTITVGEYDGSTVTQKNEIDLGSFDLSTLNPSQGSYEVSRRVGVKLDGFESDNPYANLYFGGYDAAVVAGSPVDQAFSCGSMGNAGPTTSIIGSFAVSIDVTQYTAGTYTGTIGVTLPSDVVAANPAGANGGALSITDGVLAIPVKISLTGVNPCFGPKVTGVTAKAGNTRVEVAWTPVDGCYDYAIFRRDGKDASASSPELSQYQYLSTVHLTNDTSSSAFSDPFFVDSWVNNGQTYSYLVYADDVHTAFTGTPSKAAFATPMHTVRLRPAAPFALEDRGAGDGYVYLRWCWNTKGGQSNPENEYDTGDPTDGENLVDHFNIYRNGVLVKQIKQNAYMPGNGYNDSISYEWSATAPTEQNGASYTFYVTAVDGNGIEGWPSNKVSAASENSAALAILGHTADFVTDTEWNDQAGEWVDVVRGMHIDLDAQGVARFNIWRKPANADDASYTPVTLTRADDGEEYDADVQEGKVYTYKAVGVSSKGKQTEPYVFSIAAVEDGSYVNGGQPLTISLSPVDGESVRIDWYPREDPSSYELYRDGELIESWDSVSGRVMYLDDPGADGSYRYQVKWTSKTYAGLTGASNVCTFDRFNGELDPATFAQAPGKPRLTGRLVGDNNPSVLLTWQPAESGGEPTGYIIYRSDGGITNTEQWSATTNPRQSEPAVGRYFSMQADTTQYREYVDWYDDGDSATTYDLSPHRWWIVAYNEVGLSEPSEIVEFSMGANGELPTNNDTEAPGAPRGVNAALTWDDADGTGENLSGCITVTWSAPATGGSVEDYDIRLEDQDGNVTMGAVSNGSEQRFNHEIALSDSPEYSEIGKTFTITVSATNGAGETAADPVTVKVASVPTLRATAKSATSVELSWEGLRGDAVAVSEYQLWHRSNASAWQQVHSADAPGSFVHEGIQTGSDHEYYVVAIDNAGVKHQSVIRTVKPTVQDGVLEAPTNLSARSVDGDVIVSWTPAVNGAVPAFYRLEGQVKGANDAPDPDGIWQGKNVMETTSTSAGLIIRHGSGSPFTCGETYFLRVCGMTSNHLRGATSECIEFTWPAESEAATASAQPAPIAFTAEPGDGIVELAWQKPEGADGDAITAYWVVRMDGSQSSWWGMPSDATVYTVSVADASQVEYRFVDLTVVNGQTYTYELWPLNSKPPAYRSTYYLKGVTVTPNGPTSDDWVADNMAEMAAALPDSADEMTPEQRAAFDELAANYRALDESQRQMLDDETRAKIEELIVDTAHADAATQYADDPAVTAAQDTIAALDANAISLDDDASLQAVADARAAYDALPTDARQLVDDTNLRAAEARVKQLRTAAANQATADAVSAQLAAIDYSSVDAMDEGEFEQFAGEVADLRMAYNQLTKAQKALVDPAALENLQAAEQQIDAKNGVEHEHIMKAIAAKAPTCTQGGNSAYWRCTSCGKLYADADGAHETTLEAVTLPADPEAHSWNAGIVSKKATIEEPGEMTLACSECDKTKVAEIASPATFTLSETSFAYDGKAKTPTVTVADSAGEVIEAANFEVAYEDNVNIGTATARVMFKGNRYEGEKDVAFTIGKAASTIKIAAQTKTYNGKVQAYSGKVTKTGSTGKVTYKYYSDAKCTKTVAAKSVKAAKTYYVTATVAADATYTAATSAAAKFTIVKANNPMAAKGRTATVKYVNVKKKAQVLKRSAVITVSKNQGKLTFAKKSGNKSIVINKTTGKVTVKKGLKKGTYTVKAYVKAAGNANYKAKTTLVTFKVKVA